MVFYKPKHVADNYLVDDLLEVVYRLQFTIVSFTSVLQSDKGHALPKNYLPLECTFLLYLKKGILINKHRDNFISP